MPSIVPPSPDTQDEIDPLALALFGIRDHVRHHSGCADKRGVGGHHFDDADECALADIVRRYGDRRAEALAGTDLVLCAVASEHEHMASVEHLRRCPICDMRFDPACDHDWLDRPESDTRECLICGMEVGG